MSDTKEINYRISRATEAVRIVTTAFSSMGIAASSAEKFIQDMSAWIKSMNDFDRALRKAQYDRRYKRRGERMNRK